MTDEATRVLIRTFSDLAVRTVANCLSSNLPEAMWKDPKFQAVFKSAKRRAKEKIELYIK